ncbi:hypothetical protein IGS74_08795 [Aureimonas sp. OT7]|uniref:DUF6460 domain-containing protein n=1 Tax=Aureimonas altamirensis TaxID=370622 RepID=A0A0B1QAZ2_9HYPH|nr:MULTISPECIES: DUF6460 domain-containing protein [Aureimonas]KHJ56077.1 hypothetical protein LA66_05580 [Aureimonas altamirensis]QOG08229.1 hypothetical protein IGS74_08795 [Aureimonas sp. OT7]
MPGSVSNFLGGSPLSVIVRLAILSLLVGILMSWFDIRPVEVVDWVVDFGRYLWNSVFGSLNRAIDYFLLGAVIVVPIFLISRLAKMGKRS